MGFLVLLGLGGLALASAFLTDSGGSRSQHYYEEIEELRKDLHEGYTTPVLQAQSAASACGPDVYLKSGDSSCARFVQTIENSEGTLLYTVDRLQYLMVDPPPGTQSDFTVNMESILKNLEVLRDSDQLLIEGWKGRDQAKWDEGWRLRRSLAANGG